MKVCIQCGDFNPDFEPFCSGECKWKYLNSGDWEILKLRPKPDDEKRLTPRKSTQSKLAAGGER